MSNSTLHPYQFKDQSLMTFRLYEMIMTKGGSVLRWVLLWGTPRKQPSQYFDEYLVKVKGVPRGLIRRVFNHSQREKMKRELGWDMFDVTLLYQCIQFGCDGLAPPRDRRWAESGDSLERYVTAVKNFRNNLLHEEYKIDAATFVPKTEELRELLTKTLKKAAEVFTIDGGLVASIIRKLDEDMNSIRDKPLEASSGHMYISDSLRHCVCTEGKLDMKKRYKQLSYFGPASSLLGDKAVVRVDKIFTQMKMIREESDELNPDEGDIDIEYNDMLEFLESRQSQSSKTNTAVLVEGQAGVGKTTLTRKMVSDWASETTAMKHLVDYDLLILCECRDKSIVSLTHLLESLMTNACRKVQREDLVKCVEDKKLLCIIDGLDEINPLSEQVLRQILKMGETNDVTLFCTTRPNKVHSFKNYLPENFAVVKVRITGIAESRREDFVRNYSQALSFEAKTEDISGLLHFLKRTESRLQDHWRLPFNLVLLTILWFLDTDAVNSLTTATELFMTTHKVNQRKLQKRLFEHEKTRSLEPHELKDKINKFLRRLYKEALINHYGDDTVLSEASMLRLQDTCDFLQLPSAEVLGAFLIQSTSLMDETKTRYSFPHKSLQDFYSALYITDTLLADEIALDIPRILSTFENALQSIGAPTCLSQYIDTEKIEKHGASAPARSIESVLREGAKEAAKYFTQRETENKAAQWNLKDYQNVLSHCVSLLHGLGVTVTEGRAAEIVRLLKASGITDRDQWLDLLTEIKCDTTVSKYIAYAMDLTDTVKITDSSAEAYASVLSHACPLRVDICIRNDPRQVPGLTKLLSTLSLQTCQVRLDIQNDFRQPKKGGSILEEALQKLFQSCRVTHFSGQLGKASAEKLPKSLEVLRISVSDDIHYRELSPVISSLRCRLPRLGILWLHLMAGTDSSILQQLPQIESLHVTLSGVDETTVRWACKAACSLQPVGGFWFRSLMFPGIAKSVYACEQLLLGLASKGVRVGVRIEVSPHLTPSDKTYLHDLTRPRYTISSDDDQNIWNWLL
ncbi:uncharacterized protein LOC134778504 [Penaeus indicus]|uniref:uncharacterized protein LOC134778504 n=1 Tax=Penaeus indicus TaxID=29960 RepID=UPI00300C074A